MTRQLNMAGKNSNEIYTLLYPNNLINFCKYDFTPFLNHCTDLCRLANRTGEFNVEDVYAIRNSISGCHKYYEQNMRTTFEKIVVDCWIDYLRRQSDAGLSALWQSFMRCKNDFEKAVFSRLSEYRHNRAINEWTNLLKLQEYARQKTDFVFGVPLGSAAEASARAIYFDLMFNVAANEQGFSVSDIGAACIYSAGRVPSSPFILSSASREILRNVLNNMDDASPRAKRRLNPDLSDQTAMDAFDVIKEYIPDKNDSIVKTIIKSIKGSAQRVYMPCSFKAAIDLEIDATIESGGFLQKCRRCGEFFLKDSEYPYDYCNRPRKDGATCLELADTKEAPITVETTEGDAPALTSGEGEAPKEIQPLDKEFVNEKMNALYKEMAARINVDMTQRDFSRWYQRELRLKELILFGQAGAEELERFIDLSRGDEFASKSKPAEEKEKEKEKEESKKPENETVAVTESGKEVKRFVFERVERPPELKKETLSSSEAAANEAVQRLFAARQNPQQSQQARQQYGYYSQPPYQQGKPVTRIIRGGAANTGYVERPFEQRSKPRTVIIPTGDETPKEKAAHIDEDIKLYRDESDVKIYTPHRPAAAPAPEKKENARQERDDTGFNAYIEPSLYDSDEPEPEMPESREEIQIEGQLSADDIAAPIPPATPAASAKALSAYRTLTIPKVTSPDDEKQLEKADFAGILEEMNRNDGFRSENEELDADGMPVSHKTQHVMNAVFGQTRASPFLRINLDDDDT